MEEEWTTLTNADFIQPGINLNMRSQKAQDDICLQNMMNNNTCSPMFSCHNPSLYHSSLGQYQPLALPSATATPTFNEMTEVPPMEISPLPGSQRGSPTQPFSSQPLMMAISPVSSSQHSPSEQLQMSPQPQSYKTPKSESSELANILKGEIHTQKQANSEKYPQLYITFFLN